MGSWIGKQVFKPIQNAFGGRIADPAGTADALDTLFIIQRQCCFAGGTEMRYILNSSPPKLRRCYSSSNSANGCMTGNVS